MAKNYKKGVFTLAEIGAQVFKKCPGRFKNEESACAMVRKTAQRLQIGDINGKKRFRFITANDAARIISAIITTPPKKKKKAQQICLGDILGGDPIDWLEPYTPDSAEAPQESETEEVPGRLTQEQAEAIQDLWRASRRVAELFNITEV